ncbi:hypothetical protein, partial [Actinomadura fibrosa]|uniref:hypothetical protein n=1 Tax=Actinomadura fibrosa TaxID=111802 RepID=UPI001A9545EF
MAQTLVRRLLTAGLIAAMIVGLTLAATVRIDRRAGGGRRRRGRRGGPVERDPRGGRPRLARRRR